MIKKQKTFRNLLMAGLFSTALVTTAADATQLRHATGYAPGSMGAEATLNYANALKEMSGGTVTGRVFALSLLNWVEMSDGIRDGITDSGTVLFSYFPSTFSINSMLAELSMVTQLGDTGSEQMGMAYAGALSEYIFLNCPECLAEFESQNHVFTGIGATSPYWLLCNKPVTSLAQLRGKRLRAAGANWSRWAQELGATPVSMAVNETYEGLGQGVIDCTAHNLPDLTSFNFIEVVSDITLGVPGGIFGGIATHANMDTWKSLQPDQREALMYASAAIAAELAWLYVQDHEANLRLVNEKPDISVHQAGDDFRARTRDFIEKDMVTISERYRERHNLSRAEEMVLEFREVLARWLPRVADVETSTELTELYWNEVFSRVDVNSYGLR